jgi:hypothetical protein
MTDRQAARVAFIGALIAFVAAAVVLEHRHGYSCIYQPRPGRFYDALPWFTAVIVLFGVAMLVSGGFLRRLLVAVPLAALVLGTMWFAAVSGWLGHCSP